MVEGVGLELVVGHEEIQRLVAIIVSEIEPHARLGPPVFTEAHTQRQSGLFEAAVTEVPEKKIHDRVVRDVDVGVAIFVKVDENHAQALAPR